MNDSAFDAVQRMVTRADKLGHTEPQHYLWCASQHHKLDPTTPASKWDTAWRALREAAGLPGLRFHDLRHTVVTRLLEAGEPDHVVESITGHLSRRMLEHYSHIRLKAKRPHRSPPTSRSYAKCLSLIHRADPESSTLRREWLAALDDIRKWLIREGRDAVIRERAFCGHLASSFRTAQERGATRVAGG